MKEPFADSVLARIFSTYRTTPDRLTSRENSHLEFKESFSFSNLSQYARTFSAFANAKGGHIVFGVKDNPRHLIGLKNDAFGNIDPVRITCFLNEYFDPEIHWDFHIHRLSNASFGIIYIYECSNKPIICRRSSESGKHLTEGQIYYRYRGQSKHIKYVELKNILDEQRRTEQAQWFRYLKKIASVGINNIGILDQSTGEISGEQLNFTLDENIMSQIKFIKEGEFKKTKGSATLKLIGTARFKDDSHHFTTKEVTISRGLRTDDIVYNFLDMTKPDNPKDYIRQICFESSGQLPLYYYMHLAKLSRNECLDYIKSIPSSTRSSRTLERRLAKNENFSIPKTYADKIFNTDRVTLFSKVTCNGMNDFSSHDKAILYLRGSRMCTKHDITSTTRNNVKQIFDKFYSSSAKMANEIRLAICHMDTTLFRDSIS